VTLRRWACSVCELLILVAADYAMVACPGCGSPALKPERATGEVAALWCPRCSTRFDLYIDELDPSSELFYCPRCKLENPVPVGRLSSLATSSSSSPEGG
jgi:DNA-directed RNA polymerase subunit RPC12/RpoP